MSLEVVQDAHVYPRELPEAIDLNEIFLALEEGDNVGFCLGCGAEMPNLEPDARFVKCDDCGRTLVFGAEEILMIYS